MDWTVGLLGLALVSSVWAVVSTIRMHELEAQVEELETELREKLVALRSIRNQVDSNLP